MGLEVADGRVWVIAVPDCGVVVAVSWYHDGCHDGGDVECWPYGHELVYEGLWGEVFIASFSHPFLYGNSSGVGARVRVIPIVVGLNYEPISLI